VKHPQQPQILPCQRFLPHPQCKVPLGAARGIGSSERSLKHKATCQPAQTTLSSPATTPSPPPTKPSSPTIVCARRNTKTPNPHSVPFTSSLSIPITPIPFPFLSSSRYVHHLFAVSLARGVVRSCLLSYPFALTFDTLTLAPPPSSPSIHSAPQRGGTRTYLRRLYMPSHPLLSDISTSTYSFTTLLSRYLSCI
jgi:hypothetical protein